MVDKVPLIMVLLPTLLFFFSHLAIMVCCQLEV